MTFEKSNVYKAQDRGNSKSYESYISAMDAVSIEKVASASVFFNSAPGNTIVDVGMASGTSSHILANLFPQLSIIGVDINPKMVAFASESHQLPNLEFRMDDGETLTTFEENTIHGFFNCSSIHHITSFNGYEPNRAFNTLKRQTELLKSGGIIVVRDFVKPPEMEVILELKECRENGPGDSELLIRYSKTARSLSSPNEQGFPLKEFQNFNQGFRRFQLFFSDAVEFIRRKDYTDNWDIELQEEYGYFTQKEFEDVFASLGLRVIVSNPIYNPWIISNRYKGKFTLFDKNLNDLGFSPTNYLIAGEKLDKQAKSIKIVRHLPESNEPFLKFNSYQDSISRKIFDVVLRPNAVIDIIPFYCEGNSVEIIAKHGYPRPIVNADMDSPIIDQKHYSGYIIEGLTASYNQSIEAILIDRTQLGKNDLSKTEKSLEFFTSPGGINEKIESVFVELKKSPKVELTAINSYSGFADSGSVRKYDAVQLLKTAQTGALVEARLELNIYNLLRRLNIELPPWLGEKFEIEEFFIPQISSLKEILSIKETRFIPTSESAQYLQKHRVKFSEIGIHDSTNILEFVTPKEFSINTLLTLPVARFKNEIHVGLEIRHLPVPQLQSGNSRLLVAPACRLPKEVKSYKDLENFMLNLKIHGTKIERFGKLGEKYFPSVGITPEQVYPYIVSLKEANNHLQWFGLTELYENLEYISDGHLLISIVRLLHANRSIINSTNK